MGRFFMHIRFEQIEKEDFLALLGEVSIIGSNRRRIDHFFRAKRRKPLRGGVGRWSLLFVSRA